MADLDYKIKTTSEGDGFKKTTEETHKLTQSNKDLLYQLKALSHELPFVHQAILVLRHPVAAVAAAVGIGIEAWKEYIAKLQEATEKATDATALIKPFRDFGAGAAAAKIEAAQFAAALEKIAAESHTAAKEVAALTEKQTLMAALETEKANAAKAMEQADIKLRVARGEISPLRGSQLSSGVEKKYADMADAQRLKNIERESAIAQAGLFATGLEKSNASAQKAAADTRVQQLTTEAAKRAEQDQGASGAATARLGDIDKAKNINQKAQIKRAGTDSVAGGILGLQTFGVFGEKDISATNKLAAEAQALEAEERGIKDGQRAREKANKAFAASMEAEIQKQKDAAAKIVELTKQEADLRAKVEALQSARDLTGSALASIGLSRAATAAAETTTAAVNTVNTLAGTVNTERVSVGTANVSGGGASAAAVIQLSADLHNLIEAVGFLGDKVGTLLPETAQKLREIGFRLNAERLRGSNLQQ